MSINISEKKEELIGELLLLQDNQWFSGYSSHAVEQVNSAEDKYRLFLDILGRKLSPTEIMYVRAKDTAENIMRIIFIMTEKVIDCLKAAGHIDVEYIDRHIRKIDAKEPKSEKDLERIKNLVKRYHIWNRYLKSAEERLYANEDCITQLVFTVANLSENEFSSEKTDDSLKNALANMSQLTEKFNKIAESF